MKIIAILVDKMPKTAEECPFSSGDWSPYCCMGGKCVLYTGSCPRLTAPFETGEDLEDLLDDDEEE